MCAIWRIENALKLTNREGSGLRTLCCKEAAPFSLQDRGSDECPGKGVPCPCMLLCSLTWNPCVLWGTVG